MFQVSYEFKFQVFMYIHHPYSLHNTVPDPVSVLVESVGTQGKPLFLQSSGNVTNVILSCRIQLNPAVNVPVTIETSWTGPDGFTFKDTAMNVFSVYYTSMVNVSSLNLKKAGVYHCTTTVMPSSENEFIMNKGTEENNTTLALCELTQNLAISAVNHSL